MEGDREGNINVWLPLERSLLGTWPKTKACALTGNQIRYPLVHRPELNPLSHTSQGCKPIFAPPYIHFVIGRKITWIYQNYRRWSPGIFTSRWFIFLYSRLISERRRKEIVVGEAWIVGKEEERNKSDNNGTNVNSIHFSEKLWKKST